MESALAKKTALTVVALGVYKAIGFIPLPMLDREALGVLVTPFSLDASIVGSLLHPGIAPFILGFMVVELYSLATPWGRRIRRDGSSGRRRLNDWAVGVSFLICIIQAVNSISLLEATALPGGATLVPDPGWTSRIMGVLTLTAASASAFILCNVITAKGVGNGFCLVIVLDFVTALVARRDMLLDDSGARSSQGAAIYLISLFALTLYFIYWRKSTSSYPLNREDLSDLTLHLPPFPQGILPALWGYMLLDFLPVVGTFLGLGSDFLVQGPISYEIGVILAVPLLSYATVHLFSSKNRIENALPGWPSEKELTAALGTTLARTTVSLTLAVAVFTALESYVFLEYILPGFVESALVAVVCIDLHKEWLFRKRHSSVMRLIELDNVHLAIHVKAVLRERGVDCLVQSFYFRSLFYFFKSLYKMVVLVPEDRLEDARRELETDDVTVL